MFLSLNGESEKAQILLEHINVMQLQEVDLNTLSELGSSLIAEKSSSDKNKTLFFRILDNFAAEKLKGYNLRTAANASFQLYCMGKDYTSIISEYPDINYSLLELIRTQKRLANYLLAVNYVLTLTSVLEQSRYKKSTNLDPLKRLYGNEICSYIRGYIIKNNLEAKVRDFEGRYYKKLDYAGRSTMTYIIGRCKRIQNSEKMKIFSRERMELSEPAQYPNSEYFYNYSVAFRSICVAEVVIASDYEVVGDRAPMSGYLFKLLSDAFERRINRDFYLRFYGDRSGSDFWKNDEVIELGLDFYNTYHMIANRLNRWIKSPTTRNEYPLLEIELFTLCDLIQVRIDYKFITAQRDGKRLINVSNRHEVPSLFYNEKYDKLSCKILEFMISVIDVFMDNWHIFHSGNSAESEIFSQYLRHERDAFSCLLIQKNRPIKNYQPLTPLFHAETLLRDLSSLATITKTGWHIKEKRDYLSESEYSQIVDSDFRYESVLEHIYQAYLIGLLYLPAHSQTKGYNKQSVLNMILVHDLGEAYIGDIPPSYKDYSSSRKQESLYCQRIFLSGMHFPLADLTDYLKLWNEWSGDQPSMENVQIAQDIDDIQMLYKLFELITSGKATYDAERIQDFCECIPFIRTVEGKYVFNHLIASNEDYLNVANSYGIPLRPFQNI